jgi:hypothetical protein
VQWVAWTPPPHQPHAPRRSSPTIAVCSRANRKLKFNWPCKSTCNPLRRTWVICWWTSCYRKIPPLKAQQAIPYPAKPTWIRSSSEYSDRGHRSMVTCLLASSCCNWWRTASVSQIAILHAMPNKFPATKLRRRWTERWTERWRGKCCGAGKCWRKSGGQDGVEIMYPDRGRLTLQPRLRRISSISLASYAWIPIKWSNVHLSCMAPICTNNGVVSISDESAP